MARERFAQGLKRSILPFPQEILADTPEPGQLPDGVATPEELKDEPALGLGQPREGAGHLFKERGV
jgi:hypothetical protein